MPRLFLLLLRLPPVSFFLRLRFSPFRFNAILPYELYGYSSSRSDLLSFCIPFRRFSFFDYIWSKRSLPCPQPVTYRLLKRVMSF